MPKSIVEYDFSDVGSAVQAFAAESLAQMAKVGEEAVAYAVENGDYADCSGRLRASNQYAATLGGLILANTAEYASDVEAGGKDVLGGAALYAEKRLREIFGE